MIILCKYKIFIKNFKCNLMPILNLKFKSYNININLLNSILLKYINIYNLNIFIIYIYSNKLFKIIYNYTIAFLYKKYYLKYKKFILIILYKILLYKKLQLMFYNIYQLIYIIHNNLKFLKIK
uniref:Uncharacterized protein n=1 Tax=Leucocytozoon caulleryi TaxID=211597 RepID=U3TQI0_LEUCU|nr:hypothetical protein [Leucocytozoon caulleryi]BAN94684.1 hypothetical protein [Leucocytozoon caulleryi]